MKYWQSQASSLCAHQLEKPSDLWLTVPTSPTWWGRAGDSVGWRCRKSSGWSLWRSRLWRTAARCPHSVPEGTYRWDRGPESSNGVTPCWFNTTSQPCCCSQTHCRRAVAVLIYTVKNQCKYDVKPERAYILMMQKNSHKEEKIN